MNVRRLLSGNWILLTLIFLLALLVRTIYLNTLPYGLHDDEIMNGYVGRYILQNGVDLYGNRWPLLYFDNFGDYPNVVPMYISGAFTYVFGATAFAIRFPIALFGALTVFPVFGLLHEVFHKKWAAYAGALMVALTPWHIVLSRATAEGVTAGFVFMCAMWLLVRAVRSKSVAGLLFSASLCACTYFLYPSYRVLVPLVWIVAPFLWRDKRHMAIAGVCVALFIIMTLGIAQTEWGSGRFEQTSIFASGHEVDAQTQRFVYGSDGDVRVTRLFHNKGVVGAREFMHQYMGYFSGQYLFSRGGFPERYSIPDVGLLLYAMGLLFVAAALPIHSGRAVRSDAYAIGAFLLWVLIMIPVPAALTRDDVPNVHRTALLGILYVLPAVYGLSKLTSLPKKFARAGVVLVCAIGLLELTYFARIYAMHADSHQALWRFDEMEKAVKLVVLKHDAYDVVVVPSHRHFALRYLMIQNDFGPSYAGKFTSGIYIHGIDNIEFVKSDCPSVGMTADGKLLDRYTDQHVFVLDRAECEKNPALSQIGSIQSSLGVDVYRVYEK